MKLFAIALFAVALSTSVAAQCSTLAITGSVNWGQTVNISVTGAPANSIVFLGASQSLGSTSFSLGPLGGFSLDIANPLITLPLGTASAAGAASLSLTVPAAPTGGTTPTSMTLHCQAVAIGFPTFGGGMPTGGTLPTFTFCTSNTATLQVF